MLVAAAGHRTCGNHPPPIHLRWQQGPGHERAHAACAEGPGKQPTVSSAVESLVSQLNRCSCSPLDALIRATSDPWADLPSQLQECRLPRTSLLSLALDLQKSFAL